MHDRIAQARIARGLTQVQLAEKIGLSRNYVWMMESGDRVPPYRTVADICRVLGVNETWLRTGDGEMFLDLGPDAQLEKIFDQIQLSGDDTIRAIIRTYWGLSDQDKAVIRRVILELADQIKKGQGESPGQ